MSLKGKKQSFRILRGDSENSSMEDFEIELDEDRDGILFLTPAGGKAVSSFISDIRESVDDILDKLTDNDRESTEESEDVDPQLRSLVRELEEISEALFNVGMVADHIRDESIS